MRNPIRLFVLCSVVTALLPMAARAEMLTFTWYDWSHTGSAATPSGTLTLNLTSPVGGPPAVGGAGFSQSYASLGDWQAAVVALSYTDSAGHVYTLADITNRVADVGFGQTWSVSDGSAAFPWVPSVTGNFLINDFRLESPGVSFSFQNGPGTPPYGAPGLANNVFSLDNVQDVGAWRLTDVSSVPLPPSLPLFISGLGAVLVTRRVSRAGSPARQS